ncbi:hypothetical protein SAMN05421797_107157 [Maribacter ulvicola]|uniref:Uncharacterized protein n=1 Tax=Maribacter ulvicola TaxID=228959 RepID=A0A1N6YV03_9FLAO|nr:hypothetical protein SAMN05421797_107157 [Maribacter ulvicola]
MLIVALGFVPILTFSQTNENYIGIDYSSICCGTPSKKPIIDYIKKIEANNKLKSFEMFVEDGLGKEGEYAFYIGTDNLNNKSVKSFFNGLKDIATNQNKLRSEKSDGYVNVREKFITILTLKNIKDKPRTKISSLEIYEYKNETTY